MISNQSHKPMIEESAVASAIYNQGSKLTITTPSGEVFKVSATNGKRERYRYVVFSHYLNWDRLGKPKMWGFSRCSTEATALAKLNETPAGAIRRVMVEVVDEWKPDNARVTELIEECLDKVRREGAGDKVQVALLDAMSQAANIEAAEDAPVSN